MEYISQKIWNSEVSIYGIDKVVEYYVKNDGIIIALKRMEKLSDESKKEIFKCLLITCYNYSIEYISDIITNQNDLALCYKVIYNEDVNYDVFRKIKEPKKYFDKQYLNIVIQRVPTNQIIEDYGLYFKDEILNCVNFYELLRIKDKLDTETINKIYSKINNYNIYNDSKEYLNKEDLKEYSKLFVKNRFTDVYIAYDLLVNKTYYEENIIDLLAVITMKADAKVIYNLLMNTNLDKKYVQLLENELSNISKEYYIYYLFYKDKDKFLKLFASSLIFLSYVSLNIELFTDSKVLNEITEVIKSENKDFINKIDDRMVKTLK